VARITRKELKTDRFALEVEHGLTFFEEHQKELIRYGGIAAIAAVLVFAFILYQRHERGIREAALGVAIAIQETGVGPATPGSPTNTFPTQQIKDDAAIKGFTQVKTKYPGSAEGEIAEYYLGAIRADEGNLAEAEKSFQEVAQKGDEKYASLAKLSLGQVFFAEGKADQGEKTLRDLIAHPTIFVSKEDATIALARALLHSNPAEARKLLDPLRQVPGSVSEVALTLYGQLPPQ
jgi:predicted negative regulator of RcsB-dependent stress response